MHTNKGNISPKFYSGWKLIEIAFRTSFKYYLIQRNYTAASRIISSIHNISSTIKIRKKLQLTKLIKFNKKFYSTPIIPSYPSKVFDRMASNGGLNFLDAGTPKKKQIDSAFLAITNKCELRCTHCYEQHNLDNNNKVPRNKWIEIVDNLQQMGVSIIILTGGEPLTEFEDLLKILDSANMDLSEFHIHTSGKGLTKEKVMKLKDHGLTAAAVGLDDVLAERHDGIRGERSFSIAVNALKLFNEAGIFTYVNLCATKPLIRSGDLWKYLELVKNLNVSIVQLLEPRPCGGYFGDEINDLITEQDREILKDFMKKGNNQKKYKDYPLIYYVAHIEGPEQMGCMMGGLSHFYIDSSGNVNPCVFLPVSFGNIMESEFKEIYNRMRMSIPHPLHKECPSVFLSDKLKKIHESGAKIPISFNRIKEEWEKLYDS